MEWTSAPVIYIKLQAFWITHESLKIKLQS